MNGFEQEQSFAWWNEGPRGWGPDNGWRVWFGAGVTEALAEAIREFADEVRGGPQRGLPAPAAIGCVPWLTSGPVLQELASLGGCCIVVDKTTPGSGTARAAEQLHANGEGFPNVLAKLAEMAPRVDGESQLAGPYGDMPRYQVGPVRLAGWRKREGQLGPLLHAKLLLLGILRSGEDDFGREDLHFSPKQVWWGSANWTGSSHRHLEAGFLSDDPALLKHAESFLEDLIAFSEPLDSRSVVPRPDLAEIEYDDDAFFELMARLEFDEEDG